jgi:uncharacterized protein YaaW (UPF0174 family)
MPSSETQQAPSRTAQFAKTVARQAIKQGLKKGAGLLATPIGVGLEAADLLRNPIQEGKTLVIITAVAIITLLALATFIIILPILSII